MSSLRVTLCQLPLGEPITRSIAARLRDDRPHFVCFPEYFFVNKRLGNHGQTPHNFARQQQRLSALSRHIDAVVIGGTMPELADGVMYNTCYIYDRGSPIGFYRKKNLFFAEVGKITPGDEFRVFTAGGITFGVLICADVFHDDSFLAMRERGARIVFIPTFSLKRVETVDEKYGRDRDIFVRGAGLANAVVVKVCGVKSDYKDFLQARSLVASPDEVLYRVRPDEEETSVIITQEVPL